MIVVTDQLRDFTDEVVMVDGSFDPLHDGHIAYFAAASELGLPVLCNVTSDDRTGYKHIVLLDQTRRGVVLDSIRYLSLVHLSSISTLSVLELLRPRIYVKGSDWLARGGVPQDERDLCESLEIEIKYLDTVFNSSSRILSKWAAAKSEEQHG